MFREHGSFEAMEVQIKKKHVKTKNENAGGGWYSELFLKTHENWTKTMPQLYINLLFDVQFEIHEAINFALQYSM